MRALAGRYHSRSLINLPPAVYYGPLLDQMNVPATPLTSGGNLMFALSLRLVRAGYTGNCMLIQRASDNATQAIGFNPDGTWNTGLIASFCGSSAGFIRTWYDQSGNGYNFTARSTSNTSNMYRVWTGTALDMVGTTACIKAANTVADLVSATWTAQTNTAFTLSMVACLENTVTSINGRMFSLYGASNTDSSDAVGIAFTRLGSSSPTATWSLARNPASSGPQATIAGTFSDMAQVDFSANDPSYVVDLEGTSGTTATGTQNAFSYTNAALGWSGNTHASVGEYFEVVGWNRVLTPTEIAAVRTNQAGYWNTSSASPNPGGGGSGTGATDLPGWKLIFDENFNTTAAEGSFLTKYGTNWNAYANGTPDTWGNVKNTSGQYTHTMSGSPTTDVTQVVSRYRTDNISVANNTMYLRLYVDSAGHAIGAAPMPKFPGQDGYHSGQIYYRYQFTMRCLSPVQGWKVAYLLWPDTDVWTAETDFPEGNLNGTIGGFNHHWNNVNTQDTYSSSLPFTTWHTFTVEWLANSLKWYIDGNLVKTMTSQISGEAMHGPIFQTETVLSSTNRPVAGQTCTVEVGRVSLWVPS